MGLKAPGRPSTGPVAIPGTAGLARKRSHDGGSSSTGVPLVVAAVPARKLSQATLQRIFISMMGVVLGIYAVISAYLLGHGHSKILETEGKFGPSLANNDRILKEHIKNLRKEAALARSSEARNTNKDPGASLSSLTDVQSTSSESDTSKESMNADTQKMPPRTDNLEEVDIHEMVHPKHLSKGKNPQLRPSNLDAHLPVTNHDRHATKTRMMKTDGILRAFLEPIYLDDWEKKPLPVRNTTKEILRVVEYPRVKSCRRLQEQWPIDDYPDDDPFLPWIHDVFPTDDGKNIQFVAQNKRRCQTGTTTDQLEILEAMQPQISLLQHVPVQRISTESETRYKLSSHETADPDAIETRFICQFSDGQETLSTFNLHYDYAGTRKHNKKIYTKEGHKDNKIIHTSQLIFKCPVPQNLVETVRDGSSVIDDKATLFVTLVPIRTPPRYGKPDRFLPPRFQSPTTHHNFSVAEEWGDSHVLPKIVDSGRWENIPICLPTTKAYPDVTGPPQTDEETNLQNDAKSILKSTKNTRKHRVVACTWSSTSYATRGERFAIDDGARRLDEWIRFHLLIGFDHIFVYDNSHGNASLEPVTDQFRGKVTRVPWPATICNNNRTFADSPGERSSQYAAESSCRLRFGPHTDWMANMDIDEYITPVGEYKSIKRFADKLDEEGTKIVSFGSWRAWPRRDLIEPPSPIKNKTICEDPNPCFQLKVPKDRSILQTYNCDRQIVKTEKMPAEKQIFRTDYVLQHFVHFSTVTRFTLLNDSQVFDVKKNPATKVAPDPWSRFADELQEVTMLHTKAMATQDTAGWEKACTGQSKQGSCRIGVPYPDLNTSITETKDDKGWLYNCYVNPIIENHWVPLLDKELKKSFLVNYE